MRKDQFTLAFFKNIFLSLPTRSKAFKKMENSLSDNDSDSKRIKLLRTPTPTLSLPPTPTLPPTPILDDSEYSYFHNEGESTPPAFSPVTPRFEEVIIISSDEEEEVEETSAGSPSQETISPMNNQVILTNLFQLCTVKQLANFRLVSKLWYNLSLSDWRSKTRIPLDQCMISENTYFRSNQRYCDRCKHPFWATNYSHYQNPYITFLHKFFDFINNPNNQHQIKPYRQYCLKDWEFSLNNDLIDNFWEHCGSFITSLELRDPNFPDEESFRKVVYSSCPNLKKLTINDYKVRSLSNSLYAPEEGKQYEPPKFGEQLHLKYLSIDMNHEMLPVSWLELLSHFPFLTSIKLFNADVDYDVPAMLNAINIIRKKDKDKLLIKQLDILSASLYAQDSIPNGMCDILRELKLPLESLTIDMGVKTDPEVVKELLEIHAGTLRELNIYRGPRTFPYKNFPFGVQLDKMKAFYASDKLCDNLEFLKFMPNLEILEICDATAEDKHYGSRTKIVYNTWEAELEDFQLVKLKQLRIDYVVSENDLRSLIKWMPNVERLRMYLNDKQFSIVCQNWKKLTHLDVLGNELSDEGVTGRSYQYRMDESRGTTLKAIRPNITNLEGMKDLRVFTHVNGNARPSKLSCESIYYGFLKMDNLQTLKLSWMIIDQNTRDFLLQKIPDCCVT